MRTVADGCRSYVVLPLARRGMLRSVLFALCLVMAGCDAGDDGSGGGPRATATRTIAATSTATPGATESAVPSSTATATRTLAPSTTATEAPTNTVTPMQETPTGTTTPTNATTPTDTPSPSPTPTPTVPNPTVEGPITGPGVPVVQGTTFPLAEVGYMQQEFFLVGTAQAYAKGNDFDSDGAWLAVPAGTSAAYKTRIVVHRPINDADFDGTVLFEWLNVSGGLDAAPDWISAHTEFVRKGYAWVGVSAQFVGVEGGVSPFPGLDLSLKHANPARYGSLSHPGDSFSYDIFSQAAQAIRHPVGINPLGDLVYDRIIAAGESQSAFRLVTYVNAIHPLHHLFDAYMLHSRGGGGAALSQAPQESLPVASPARIRTDLDVPVLTLQTETDLITLGYAPDRQDDNPMFRLWEVAGTSHADTYTLLVGFADQGDDPAVAKVLTDVSAPIPGIIECATPVNSGPQHWVLKGAFAALERWVRDGVAPTSAPRLELNPGTPPQFVLDEHGNVRGGIRTSYVDAPVATLSGLGQMGAAFCRIFGTTVGFDDETLASLYPDHASYVAAINAATDAAVDSGFIVEEDGELIKTEAAGSDIGG